MPIRPIFMSALAIFALGAFGLKYHHDMADLQARNDRRVAACERFSGKTLGNEDGLITEGNGKVACFSKDSSLLWTQALRMSPEACDQIGIVLGNDDGPAIQENRFVACLAEGSAMIDPFPDPGPR